MHDKDCLEYRIEMFKLAGKDEREIFDLIHGQTWNLKERLTPTPIDECVDSFYLQTSDLAKINLLKVVTKDILEGRVVGGHPIEEQKMGNFYKCYLTGTAARVHKLHMVDKWIHKPLENKKL